MKVLLLLTLIAIIYGWYLSKNKSFINKCKEEHKNRQEKLTKRTKRNRRRNSKPKKSRKIIKRKKRRK